MCYRPTSVKTARSPLITLLVLATSACAIRLANPEDSGPDGQVTGAAADCSKVAESDAPVPFGSAAPRLVGRFQVEGDGSAQFAWSGSEIAARFTGSSSISVRLSVPEKPDPGLEPRVNPEPDPEGKNRSFTVVIDRGEPTRLLVASPRDKDGKLERDKEGNAAERTYELASRLDPAATHEVVLHRNFEASGGILTFKGLQLSPGGRFLQPLVRLDKDKKPRRILLIGDSISCGFGVKGKNASCLFSYGDQDHYLTYGSIAARTLDAELTTVCWSGRGLVRNRFDPGETLKTMPGLANYAAPSVEDSTKAAPAPAPLKPPQDEDQTQAVVVNLGTNDVQRDNQESPAEFDVFLVGFLAEAKRFCLALLDRYPKAQVFFALSPMLSDNLGEPQRSSIRKTLRDAITSAKNPRAHYMEFSEQRGGRDGLGCSFHPSETTHKNMAGQLARAIQSKLCW